MAVIVALAFVVRLAVIVGTPGYGPVGDPADYDRVAQSIEQTGRYPETDLAAPGGPSAYRQPAYPLVLAGAYAVIGKYATTGKRFIAGRLVGALLGTASVLLVLLLVARVVDRRHALVAAGVVALAPPLVWLNGSLLSESLFIPLVLAMALCVTFEGWRPAMGAGVLLGLAVLTRGNGLLLAVPLVVGMGINRRTAVALGCCLLVLVPWTVRNASVLDRLLPLGTQSGLTMAGQWNNAGTRGGLFHTFWLQPQTVPELSGLFRRPGVDEGDLDARLRSRAVRFAADHPGRVADATVTNALRSAGVGPDSGLIDRISYGEMGVPPGWLWVLRWSEWLLLALAAGGAIARRAGPVWLWLVPLLLFVGEVAWSGAPRYVTPLLPFLAIPAATALLGLGQRPIRLRSRRSLPGSANR